MKSKPVHSLGARRKQILYRANHRGIKEMDILLGGFADARLRDMDEEELLRFEAVLALPDQDLLAWLTGVRQPPEGTDREMLDEIAAYQSSQAAD